jgi:hypothetical protein
MTVKRVLSEWLTHTLACLNVVQMDVEPRNKQSWLRFGPTLVGIRSLHG